MNSPKKIHANPVKRFQTEANRTSVPMKLALCDYFLGDSSSRQIWKKRLEQSDWAAGQSLCRRLETETLLSKTGENPRLLLLIDEENDTIASYCVLSEKDDIQPISLSPWIGYVYTFPEYRKRNLMGLLLKEAEELACSSGASAVYISTGHTGLYERWGYQFLDTALNMHGELSRIYTRPLSSQNFCE